MLYFVGDLEKYGEGFKDGTTVKLAKDVVNGIYRDFTASMYKLKDTEGVVSVLYKNKIRVY